MVRVTVSSPGLYAHMVTLFEEGDLHLRGERKSSAALRDCASFGGLSFPNVLQDEGHALFPCSSCRRQEDVVQERSQGRSCWPPSAPRRPVLRPAFDQLHGSSLPIEFSSCGQREPVGHVRDQATHGGRGSPPAYELNAEAFEDELLHGQHPCQHRLDVGDGALPLVGEAVEDRRLARKGIADLAGRHSGGRGGFGTISESLRSCTRCCPQLFEDGIFPAEGAAEQGDNRHGVLLHAASKRQATMRGQIFSPSLVCVGS